MEYMINVRSYRCNIYEQKTNMFKVKKKRNCPDPKKGLLVRESGLLLIRILAKDSPSRSHMAPSLATGFT